MSLHSNEPKSLSSGVEGEERQVRFVPCTRVAQERTNQTDSGSVPGYIEEPAAHSENAQVDTREQGNDCEGHQGDQHHTILHKEMSSGLPTSEAETNYTFKDESHTPPMEQARSAKDDKGVSGIANMRNTCYMNSALQALRHNTEISAFFLENKHEQWIQRKPGSPKVELVKAYADLLKSLWSASRPAYVRPSGFLQSMIPAAIAAGFDQFQVPLQHDSHEFLTFILDQLHEGMAEEVNIEINRPKPITQQDHAIQNALEAWKRLFGKQYSPFTEMIYGLFRITMRCQRCNHSSDTWETFNCLKLPMHQGKEAATLDSMFKEEFQEEIIEGYACDKCSPERTTASRQVRIWRLPRMIVLVLKRFTMDGRKLYTPFQMPCFEGLTFKPYFSPDSPEPSQHQRYDCFATVDHHGSSGGGHYTAQAKSPLTDKWHLFDDETASPISEPQFGISTYVLFFKPSSKAAEA
jgi:ubiquitin carboxyl-terminal hydrolase 8